MFLRGIATYTETNPPRRGKSLLTTKGSSQRRRAGSQFAGVWEEYVMSLISSATAMSQQFSPLSRLQSELASEVSSGTISSGDQSALSSALTDINSAMQSQAPSAGSPPSPGAMKSKIDSLIDGEVKDGKLTSAQADELKNVFAQAFQGGPGGSGGPGGPGGSGGGGGASQTSSDPADTNGDGVVSAAEQAAYDAKYPAQAKATTKSSASSSDASSSNSSNSDASKLLSDFIKLIQDSQKSSSNYSANGDNLVSQIQSLIVNYKA
jgi:hypothetical protein